MSKLITGNLNKAKFTINCAPGNITGYQAVDYDKECGSSNDQCEHEFSRCRVLTNICKDDFDLAGFIKYNLIIEKATAEESINLISLITKDLLQVNFKDAVDAYGERDYYGECLVKEIPNLDSLLNEIKERLEEDFSNLQIVDE